MDVVELSWIAENSRMISQIGHFSSPLYLQISVAAKCTRTSYLFVSRCAHSQTRLGNKNPGVTLPFQGIRTSKINSLRFFFWVKLKCEIKAVIGMFIHGMPSHLY